VILGDDVAKHRLVGPWNVLTTGGLHCRCDRHSNRERALSWMREVAHSGEFASSATVSWFWTGLRLVGRCLFAGL